MDGTLGDSVCVRVLVGVGNVHPARAIDGAPSTIALRPTFKVFKGQKEVETVSGFPGEDRLKEMLLKHGAQLAKKD